MQTIPFKLINAREFEPDFEGKIYFVPRIGATYEEMGICLPDVRIILISTGEITFDEIEYWFPIPSSPM